MVASHSGIRSLIRHFMTQVLLKECRFSDSSTSTAARGRRGRAVDRLSLKLNVTEEGLLIKSNHFSHKPIHILVSLPRGKKRNPALPQAHHATHQSKSTLGTESSRGSHYSTVTHHSTVTQRASTLSHPSHLHY